MLLFAPLPATSQASPAQLLRSMATVEATHARQAATITVTSNLSENAVKTVYKMALVRPDRLRLEIIGHDSAGHPTDRFVAIRGGALTAYDKVANQVLTRPLKRQGSLADKLGHSFGDIDEPVMLFLDDKKMRDFADKLAASPGWKVSRISDGLMTLQRNNGSVVVVLRTTTHFPVRMRFTSGSKAVEWDFQLHATPSSTILLVPARAKRVNFFFERTPEPTYGDAKAKEKIRGAIEAYREATSLHYKVSKGGKDSAEVYWQGISARQQNATFRWGYHNGLLTTYGFGKAYRGKAPLGRVADYLEALHGSMDPSLRILLSGRNPLEVLSLPGMKARTVGESDALTVVELSSPGLRINVGFAKANPLPRDLATENLDPKGRVVSTSEESFTYPSKPSTHFDARVFNVIPPGTTALPLPHLKGS